jgi:hypothetical protein
MVFHVFLGVFENVSDACFKCFICLQTYVAKCFKSRSGAAQVAMAPVSGGQLSGKGFGSYLARRASSSPLLSLPSIPFSPSRLSVGVRVGVGVGVVERATF